MDASAMLAYLQGEPGHLEVGKALTHAADNEPLLMSAVNWGEVVYILNRVVGSEKAQEAMSVVASFPIDIVPADQAAAEKASEFKSSKKLAYADGFAAALTHFSEGELLTADRDFESVKKDIKVRLIR